jgi:hypothetical protein
MVFILLGPPNYAARSLVDAGEEGVSRASDLAKPASGLRDRSNRVDSESLRLGSWQKKGSREVWYYRADRLPKELPFRELRFDFLTREGYGVGVLQKDAVNLSALSKMAALFTQQK